MNTMPHPVRARCALGAPHCTLPVEHDGARCWLHDGPDPRAVAIRAAVATEVRTVLRRAS